MKNLLKIGLAICCTLVFMGCEKESYKFDLTTVDNKIIKLTTENVFFIKNHASQTNFDKYNLTDIKKIGYARNVVPYTSQNVLFDKYVQNFYANVLFIEFTNNTTNTFFLSQNDDIENILKLSGIKMEPLNIKIKN